MHEFLKTISRICEIRGGVKPAFDEYHVIKALKLIKEKQPIGRITLSKLLNLGESSTKNLIRRLNVYGLVNIDEVAGVLLTDKGLRLMSYIEGLLKFIDIDISTIVKWSSYVSAIIKGGYDLVKECGGILWLRDLVIRNGGDACLILTFKRNKLLLPSPDKEYVIDDKLKKQVINFSAKEGDLILIVQGAGKDVAERALIHSFLNLMKCGDHK